MLKFKMMLIDMDKDDILIQTDECLTLEGENIKLVMSRFSVINNGTNDELNPRLKELEAFSNLDLKILSNIDYSATINNVINNAISKERYKIVNMCLDQLILENKYATLFFSTLNSMIRTNNTYYGKLKDFYVVQNNDLEFVINAFNDGIKSNLISNDYSYHEGYIDIVNYYKNNINENQNIVLILESDSFNLNETLIDHNLINVKNILKDINFHNFMNELKDDEDDEYDILRADDYFIKFLNSNHISPENISRKILIEYVIEEDLKNNIINKEFIAKVRSEQLY